MAVLLRVLLEYLRVACVGGEENASGRAFASSNLVLHKILQPISGRVFDLSSG